jgi:hypothetical protein
MLELGLLRSGEWQTTWTAILTAPVLWRTLTVGHCARGASLPIAPQPLLALLPTLEGLMGGGQRGWLQARRRSGGGRTGRRREEGQQAAGAERRVEGAGR